MLISFVVVFVSTLICEATPVVSSGEKSTSSQLSSADALTLLDPVEYAAKLLIDLDVKIEEFLTKSKRKDANPVQEELEKTSAQDVFNPIVVVHYQAHLYDNQGTPINHTNINQSIIKAREEKFSEVLKDLTQLEQQIHELIREANSKRRFAQAARLRSLLTYVGHIKRNLDLLRNRVVAIATLSTIAATVNEVVDRFGDVVINASNMVIDGSGVVVSNPLSAWGSNVINPFARPVSPPDNAEFVTSEQPPTTPVKRLKNTGFWN